MTRLQNALNTPLGTPLPDVLMISSKKDKKSFKNYKHLSFYNIKYQIIKTQFLEIRNIYFKIIVLSRKSEIVSQKQ